MRKRVFKIALAGILAAAVVATFASAATALSWTDLPDSLLSSYGITNDQVAQISQGFGNRLWRPEQQITRAQFAKMACLALGIAQMSPAAATFTDVSLGSPFYPYIEGAAAAGLVHGVSAGHYAPNSYITREQGLTIIARAVARATSLDLSTVYTPSQVSGWLASFADGIQVSTSLRSAVAFAVNLNVVRNSEGDLLPRAWLTRIEAAVFLIRAGAPTVASVTPGQGGADGGDTVTVTGTGFSDANEVKFGTADAEAFSVVSDTQLTAVTPAGIVGTTVKVVVVNLEGSSDIWDVSYDYVYPLPVIASLSSSNGSPNGGNTAIINGTGFTGATAVQFGGTDVTSFTVNSDTRITVVVPAGIAGQTVQVTVVGPAGTSVVDPTIDSYTYRYPTVTSVSPTHGPASGGNTVTLTGIGFTNLVGVDAVKFGNQNAVNYQVQSDVKITAVVPQGEAGESVAVTVTGQDAAFIVTYTYDAMTITAVNADHGPFGGGNTVTITGSGFTEVTNVYFDGLPSPSVSVVSDTQIRAMVPAYSGPDDTSAPRPVTVSMRNTDGQVASVDELYTYSVPTVRYVDPPSLSSDGGDVIIHGIGFDCGSIIAVYFGSTLATSWYVVDGTQLAVTVPAGAPGSKVNVYVVNQYGSSIDQVIFTYNPNP